MSEQLDNELKKRINEVFEHYEDTAPAHEGWLLLRKKFPQKKERRITPLWWSAAATLLILCMLGVWFYNQPKRAAQVTVKNNKPLNLTDTVSAVKPESATSTGDLITTKQQYTVVNKKTVPGEPVYRVPSITMQTKETPLPENTINAKPNQQLTAVNSAPVASAINGLPITNSDAALTAAKDQQTDNKSTADQSILAQQSSKTQQKFNTTSAKDSVAAASNSPMITFLANEQKKADAKKTERESKTITDKRVLYSVYAATYFNYAEGSKSQMNTGAGFGTDIKLFNNFKLSTGVAIAKNTLNYNGQPTQAGILNEAVGVSRASENFSSAAPVTSALGFVAARVVSTPVVTGYDVSLTGLDVPLNLKYEFNPKKSDSYISAGLSSGTFINETYNYRYDNSLNAFGVSPAIPDATTRKSFTRFDFARTLNVSLGMGYQITKNNRLVIEPFLKYPLNGLGSQQIRFGAGGINLRLKFQGTKK